VILGCSAKESVFKRPGVIFSNLWGTLGTGMIQPNFCPGPSSVDSTISVSTPSRYLSNARCTGIFGSLTYGSGRIVPSAKEIRQNEKKRRKNKTAISVDLRLMAYSILKRNYFCLLDLQGIYS